MEQVLVQTLVRASLLKVEWILSAALKEASETKYWLELLMETEYINDTQFDSINDDIGRIIGTLVNIVNSTKSHNV